MIAHARALTAGLAVLVAATTASAADPARPDDLGKPAVERWARGLGMKVEGLIPVAIVDEGVFYAERTVDQLPWRDDMHRRLVAQVRFERFAPATDAKGKAVRSELAKVWLDCGEPKYWMPLAPKIPDPRLNVRLKLYDKPKAYSEHQGAGRFVGAGDPALWARLVPAGPVESPVAADALAAGLAEGACRGSRIPTVEPVSGALR